MLESETSIVYPLLLSLFAGLATGLGGMFLLCVNEKLSHSQLAASLGSTAGVMIVVSILDLWLPQCLEGGFLRPTLFATIGFFSFFFGRKFIPEVSTEDILRMKGETLLEEDIEVQTSKSLAKITPETKRQLRLVFFT